MVRIVAVADTHDAHDKIVVPDGDILIHAGDITMMGGKKKIKAFLDWVAKLPHPHKIIIAGNHDLDMDPSTAMYADLKMKELMDSYTKEHNIHYLCDSGVTIRSGLLGSGHSSIKIWGSPYTPAYHNVDDWVFQYERGDATRSWSEIPDDTDILITHGPPQGILDTIEHDNRTKDENGGCSALRARVDQVKPKIHIFGHLHDDGGKTFQSKDGDTLFVNAAVGYDDEWYPGEIPEAVCINY